MYCFLDTPDSKKTVKKQFFKKLFRVAAPIFKKFIGGGGGYGGNNGKRRYAIYGHTNYVFYRRRVLPT